MQILLIIVSILLIAIVILQSGKSATASSSIMGGNDEFANRKERGSELFITRLTAVLGVAFFVICIAMEFIG